MRQLLNKRIHTCCFILLHLIFWQAIPYIIQTYYIYILACICILITKCYCTAFYFWTLISYSIIIIIYPNPELIRIISYKKCSVNYNICCLFSSIIIIENKCQFFICIFCHFQCIISIFIF